jgi:hypothetical protein
MMDTQQDTETLVLSPPVARAGSPRTMQLVVFAAESIISSLQS